MPSDSSSDVKFEIGHVLFIDIVGYSKLLITEQTAQIERLRQAVRGTEQFRQAEREGKLLRLPTGDGGALVFRTSPEAPVACAVEVAEAIKNEPQLQVRMGIHSGPVNQITDLNEQANIAGAGVNIAQRVMDCGDAGHILLSKRVADDLAPYPKWNRYLHDLGDCEVKHGERIGLVNFYSEEVGNSDRPRRCAAQTSLESTATDANRPDGRLVLGLIALLIGGIGIGAFLVWRQLPRKAAEPQSPQPVSINSKSIAVLPFENLSGNPENAYFVDGIQEEILTRLSRIADLKVISRTSTQRYKSAPANLREIAEQLGVAHILEGSVQRAADQVRVNVQLIQAQNDSHLWADNYDRKLNDVFAVESEIAGKIADTLKAKLTNSEQHAIVARPTENTEAHELYLRGRYLWEKRTAEDLQRAIEHFEGAIGRDPGYARAYAGIADCYAVLPAFSKLSYKECHRKAREAAEQALKLDNDLAEAHASRAILLLDESKFQEAAREYQRAIELDPNYATAYYWNGYTVFLPLGKFDEAILQIKKALQLDPLSAVINTNLGYTYYLARRNPDAIVQLHQIIEIYPRFSYAHGILALALEKRGDIAAALSEAQKANELTPDFHLLTLIARQYALKGERERALQVRQQLRQLEQQGSVSHYGMALIALALNDRSEALDRLERSYRALEISNIGLIRVDPLLDPLRGDPRFESLVNKVVPADQL